MITYFKSEITSVRENKIYAKRLSMAMDVFMSDELTSEFEVYPPQIIAPDYKGAGMTGLPPIGTLCYVIYDTTEKTGQILTYTIPINQSIGGMFYPKDQISGGLSVNLGGFTDVGYDIDPIGLFKIYAGTKVGIDLQGHIGNIESRAVSMNSKTWSGWSSFGIEPIPGNQGFRGKYELVVSDKWDDGQLTEEMYKSKVGVETSKILNGNDYYINKSFLTMGGSVIHDYLALFGAKIARDSSDTADAFGAIAFAGVSNPNIFRIYGKQVSQSRDSWATYQQYWSGLTGEYVNMVRHDVSSSIGTSNDSMGKSIGFDLASNSKAASEWLIKSNSSSIDESVYFGGVKVLERKVSSSGVDLKLDEGTELNITIGDVSLKVSKSLVELTCGSVKAEISDSAISLSQGANIIEIGDTITVTGVTTFKGNVSINGNLSF